MEHALSNCGNIKYYTVAYLPLFLLFTIMSSNCNYRFLLRKGRNSTFLRGLMPISTKSYFFLNKFIVFTALP